MLSSVVVTEPQNLNDNVASSTALKLRQSGFSPKVVKKLEKSLIEASNFNPSPNYYGYITGGGNLAIDSGLITVGDSGLIHAGDLGCGLTFGTEDINLNADNGVNVSHALDVGGDLTAATITMTGKIDTSGEVEAEHLHSTDDIVADASIAAFDRLCVCDPYCLERSDTHLHSITFD